MMVMTISSLETKLRSLLHGEHSSLTISFNEHAANYCDAKTAILDGIIEHGEWINPEEKQKAIDTNSVWSIHWYPHTPVGFNCVFASTLEAVLEEALRPDA